MKRNRALAAACATIVMSLCLPAAAAESAFKLRNAASGLYLSVTGAVRQDGANMIQWRDVGQPDAVWIFERQGGQGVRIRNAVSGKYVTVTGTGNAIQWRDAGQPGLIWVQEKTKTADCYKLRNRGSGLYLAAGEGVPAKGRNVVQRADAGQPGLTWCREAIEDPDSTTAAARTLKLRNDYSRMYLAVQDGSSRDGGNVIQTGHAGRPGIVWVLERHDAKTFRIRNANSGRYLAVAGDSTAAGGNVIQSADTGRPGLIWERETAETGNCYKFRNHNSGMYLTVDDGSQEEGANVIQWGDVGHRLDIEWCREK